MTDPLAPKDKDPYCLLDLQAAATPADADAAMDAYNQASPGREMDAIAARDAIRNPAKRLAIDIFRYQLPEEVQASWRDLDSLFALAATEIREAMRPLAEGLEFGPAKDVLRVDDFTK